MIYFQPNCTIPPDPPAFVSTPDIRSTTNIVWSCVSTILLSCWSIQHLSVPPQFQPKTTRQKLMRTLFYIGRKIAWMALTLFAPEMIFTKATLDLRACLLNNPILEQLADEDRVLWGRIHTFLADMGGFAIRFTPHNPSIDRQSPPALFNDIDADRRPPSRGGISRITRGGQQVPSGTKVKWYQRRRQGLVRSSSLPTPLWPRISQNGTRLSRIRAHGSTPNVEGSSPQFDLPNLLSTTEQRNRHARSSPEMAQNQQQLEESREWTAELGAESLNWRSRRQRFRGAIVSTSRWFGDTVWRAFEPNEDHVANILSTTVASTMEKGERWTLVSMLLMLEGDVWVLTAGQLIEARRRQLIAQLPHTTEDELSDRSKGNLLLKLLALLQVLWIMIKIITRATSHLSSAPLEIMTLSLAALAFFTYLLLLGRPQDITTSMYIEASRLPTLEDVRRIVDLSPAIRISVILLPFLPTISFHRKNRRG